MKREAKKLGVAKVLKLDRTTVRTLEGVDLARVAGGGDDIPDTWDKDPRSIECCRQF
jgi:hypothetical protein